MHIKYIRTPLVHLIFLIPFIYFIFSKKNNAKLVRGNGQQGLAFGFTIKSYLPEIFKLKSV